MSTTSRFLLSAALLISAVSAQTRPSPPFTVQRVNAAPITIESQRGKIAVLAFMLTTCTHCQDVTRNTLSPIFKEYAPRGVQVIGCVIDDKAVTLLPGFIRQFQPAFPIGYASNLSVLGYLQRSILDRRPFYVPHIVLIDREGIIRADYSGESEFMKNPNANLRAELDKLLAAKSPAKAKNSSRKAK